MLIYLNIKNFAIISEAELELQPGMTVLTGETGAGKSTIAHALDLVFGARNDACSIRAGCDRCEIAAGFDLNLIPDAKIWLSDREFCNNGDANECLIRRIIICDGRSRSSINGIPCTQQMVKEFGGLLLNIYGQHEHQSLLKRDKQRDMLDDFARHEELCSAVKKSYRKMVEAQEELAALKDAAADGDVKIEFMRYQLQELENLELVKDEVENLHRELQTLSNADSTIANCEGALNLIQSDDGADTVTRNLFAAKTFLEKANTSCHSDKIGTGNIDPKLANALSLLSNSYIQIEAAREEIRSFLAKIEVNPERLRQVELRLDAIYGLARKHRVKPEGLPGVLTSLQHDLEELENASQRIEFYEKVCQVNEEEYFHAAKKLSASRKKAAAKLAELVGEKMQFLGMEGGAFTVDFAANARQEYSLNGIEQVEFLFTANKAQPLLPLNKVASGGELSRLSLALQAIVSKNTAAATLVFDEVDVGIGGMTAEIVGKLLKSMGMTRQILCITHLPQVASCGDQHIKAEKCISGSAVSLTFRSLDKASRIDEIARMLGGIDITAKTIEHAREMLESKT